MPSPSLNAGNKPSWIARRIKGVATTIWPEMFEQEEITMTKWGVVNRVKTKSGRSVFGEFMGSSNPMAIDRPSGGNPNSADRAILNNKGFVYAAVNAKAREVMAIDWRLFEVNGEDHGEKKDHEILDPACAVGPSEQNRR